MTWCLENRPMNFRQNMQPQEKRLQTFYSKMIIYITQWHNDEGTGRRYLKSQCQTNRILEMLANFKKN